MSLLPDFCMAVSASRSLAAFLMRPLHNSSTRINGGLFSFPGAGAGCVGDSVHRLANIFDRCFGILDVCGQIQAHFRHAGAFSHSPRLLL